MYLRFPSVRLLIFSLNFSFISPVTKPSFKSLSIVGMVGMGAPDSSLDANGQNRCPMDIIHVPQIQHVTNSSRTPWTPNCQASPALSEHYEFLAKNTRVAGYPSHLLTFIDIHLHHDLHASSSFPARCMLFA
jgi:hypothetical protein